MDFLLSPTARTLKLDGTDDGDAALVATSDADDMQAIAIQRESECGGFKLRWPVCQGLSRTEVFGGALETVYVETTDDYKEALRIVVLSTIRIDFERSSTAARQKHLRTGISSRSRATPVCGSTVNWECIASSFTNRHYTKDHGKGGPAASDWHFRGSGY
ncbi:hypothetical protein NGM10_17655 (plasmid) [Halorussus salilacus]|uniref:hypothetical protein n=1 Tax=Halorussus salilacus TaxID=2953750 RepID=UPI0020A10B33|nr:hypothetical protein [Halorussus salilacus]USZ70023.1 hypothetical protein NGM10_17655 [Halorussus salilacus]